MCYVHGGTGPATEAVSPSAETAGGTHVVSLKTVWYIEEKWQRCSNNQFLLHVCILLLLHILASVEVNVAFSGFYR